jgi:hypothetical protein
MKKRAHIHHDPCDGIGQRLVLHCISLLALVAERRTADLLAVRSGDT